MCLKTSCIFWHWHSSRRYKKSYISRYQNEVNAALRSLNLIPDSFYLQFKFSVCLWVRILYNCINEFGAFCFLYVALKMYYNCRKTQNTVPLNGLVELLLKDLFNSNKRAAGDSISLLLDQLLQTVCRACAARWESSAVKDITKHRWDWHCECMERNSSGSVCPCGRTISSKWCRQLKPTPC